MLVDVRSSRMSESRVFAEVTWHTDIRPERMRRHSGKARICAMCGRRPMDALEIPEQSNTESQNARTPVPCIKRVPGSARLKGSHLGNDRSTKLGWWHTWDPRVRRAKAMKHLYQTLTNAGFELRTISCNLDFAIGVPRITKTSSAIEW